MSTPAPAIQTSSRPWLVTGAQGQLGRALRALGPARGIDVQGLSRPELDITDSDAFRRTIDRIEPAVVVNCAALTKVDLCEERPEEAQRVNALAPEALARACVGRTSLVHVSTEYVFDGRGNRPLSEDAPTAPISVYGRTKLAGERAVLASGAEALVVRTQWVFGAGACFPRTIRQLAATQAELRVVEDQIGRPTWTGALADGIFRAVAAGARGRLHLACEGIASWYDFAREVVAAGARRGWNPLVPVRAVSTEDFPRPAARPAYAVLGLARARALGIEMPHWRDALGAFMDAEDGHRDA